jgi:hypothetical protein
MCDIILDFFLNISLDALIVGTTGMVIYSSWVYLPPYLRSVMATLQTPTETTIEPS